MPRTARVVSSTGYYHVVMKGNGGQLIFEDAADRRFFLDRLGCSMDENEVAIIAWCLMDNHVHLCVREDEEACGSHLAAAMSSLATGYAMRFNWKTGHEGHLFSGRYASKPIEDVEYLLEAVRYIHNNPAKAGICPAADYRWSSYNEYVTVPLLCDTSVVLGELGGIDAFIEFHNSASLVQYEFPRRGQVPDEKMRSVAIAALGGMEPSSIKALPKVDRNKRLGMLRAAGLSVRQIARMTGIGKNTVTRATTG